MPKKSGIGAATATLVVLGMFGTFTASAQAPTFEPAQRVCEREGGFFLEGGAAYRCQFSEVTAYREPPARAICEHVYDGIFIGEDDNYLCLFPLPL